MSTATSSPPPTRSPVFNLANQLTVSRFVLAIGLFVLISIEQWLLSTAIFVLAAFTDWLDGYLARKWALGSTLGRNLDPLVDKILICGAFTFLIPFRESGIMPWMVTVVVTRELLVTSLRSFLENQGAKFGADWLGKVKMVLQCGSLIAILLYLSWQGVEWLAWTRVLRDVFIYGMIFSTIISGLQYLWRAFHLFRADE